MHEVLEPTQDLGWIRIAGRPVEVTLVEGEPMEMRNAATTRELTIGATLQVSL